MVNCKTVTVLNDKSLRALALAGDQELTRK